MAKPTSLKVAILGASSNTERYSNMALKLLKENGHQVFPIHPKEKGIEGETTFSSLVELAQAHPNEVHTLTMYVNPNISAALRDDIIGLVPKRVIFNPGSENEILEKSLQDSSIETLHACTLVLLRTHQFLSTSS